MTIAHTVTQTLTGTPQGHKATLRAGVCVCVWSSLQWWTCETPVLLIARIPAAFSPGLHPYRPLQYGVCSNFCLHPTVNTSSVLIILMLLLRLISKCMCVWVRDRDRKRYRKTDKWGGLGLEETERQIRECDPGWELNPPCLSVWTGAADCRGAAGFAVSFHFRWLTSQPAEHPPLSLVI